jgi:hypothetical protein
MNEFRKLEFIYSNGQLLIVVLRERPRIAAEDD